MIVGDSSVVSRAAPRIAVLVPCYNEAVTIGAVVRDFSAALPGADIYVYDNNSSDGTSERAREAGAIVRAEPLQGKGNVVRRMFSDIEADIYILVDGDATYDAASAPAMIDALIVHQCDCVTATRIEQEQAAYRAGHRFGNRVITGMVTLLFGRGTRDMLSGYRVFSRRFVKSFPAMASGFEIETEFTVHALEQRMIMVDLETPYFGRPEGSASKLNTYKDGIRIVRTIANLVKEEKPLAFFGGVAFSLALAAMVAFIPIYIEYLETGLVRRFPTAILSAALMLAAGLSFTCGLVLDTVTLGRREMKRLAYMRQPGPPSGPWRMTDATEREASIRSVVS
ncbi:glycosyltransferase family 2 protein [Alsobacter sp. R-9]